MKKRLLILFLLPVLFSCTPHIIDKKDPPAKTTYNLEVIGTNKNISPDLPESGKYYAGKEISFKVALVTDVSFYIYLNNEKIKPYEYGDSLGDYDKYKITMPEKDSTLVLTSEEFYLDRDYKLSEIYYWINSFTRNDLTKITIEEGIAGVDPNFYPPIVKSSTNPIDLEYNFNFLTTETLRKTQDQHVTGGHFINVTYTFNDIADFEIKIYAGCITWMSFSSNQMFQLNSPSENYPKILYPITSE